MTKVTRRVVDGGAAGLDILAFGTKAEIKTYLVTSEIDGAKDVFFRSKSTQNGSWAVGDLMGGHVVDTADVSGGGVGVAAGWAAYVTSGIGSSVVYRVYGSTTGARNVPFLDVVPDGIAPINNGTGNLGTSLLQFLQGFIRSLFFGSAGAVLTSHTATPEGAITAPVGSICTDTTNGVIYSKKTGTGNTGWKLVTQAV
ncbi:hypothetical protein [Sinorhizobium meliloti]|uniref:hypothetical protein n=1 Tax=Rhizobium meliloti TaxID=382 RepID=UPI0013E2C4C4|nr:hypothetical protein [Sinorhizobium meliloti]